MLPTQLLRVLERIQIAPIDYPGKKLEAQDIRWRKRSRNLVKTPLRRRQNGFALLMKQCWEQEELRMVNLKTVTLFANAPFPKNDNLLSATQRIDDDGPFFESNFHEAKIRILQGFVQPSREPSDALDRKNFQKPINSKMKRLSAAKSHP